MSRDIAIGIQDFEKIRKNNKFYIDKTSFIKEWWENGDDVTLINRPRRFGKTLAMNMLDCFFSIRYKDREDLFDGLDIWKEEQYRLIQGTYPVISLSFAKIKDTSYELMYKSICLLIYNTIKKYNYIFESDKLSKDDKAVFDKTKEDLLNYKLDSTISDSLNLLSELMGIYYGKNVIILLDEYDTPMQEAYIYGYWDEAAQFFRSLFNATFKTNPYMERGIITGITRISKESLFSDLNNLEVVTTTSEKYSTSFGFTEDEVFAAMDEYGITSKSEMKRWYDGFTFGNTKDVYNPWSVTNALEKKKYMPYWANTSSNGLINKLLQVANTDIKNKLECLIKNESIECIIDEEIIFNQLDLDADAIWSLMLASGYVTVLRVFKNYGDVEEPETAEDVYELKLTNLEIRKMMRKMIKGWFKTTKVEYNSFIKSLLIDDVDSMNEFMNEIALNSFSSFDTGKSASGKDAPERFYHGFVLGLMVELDGRYGIKSNRESGFGRYDIMLIPRDKVNDKAYIIEFKVKKPKEATIEDTLKNALVQIEEKQYEQELLNVGVTRENIRKYGFAFEGKRVLIG